MQENRKRWLGVVAVATATAAVLAGCAAPGGYNNGYGGYGAPPPPNAGYQNPNVSQAPQGAVYFGRVESIEPLSQQQSSNGLVGTLIGGAAGGLLGHQVGGGRGNTVATIGGAVLGAVAGNQIDKRATTNSQTTYRVNVRLDDGRMATVQQANLNGLQVGARARVANDMAVPY